MNSQISLGSEAFDNNCNLGMVEEIHFSSRFYLSIFKNGQFGDSEILEPVECLGPWAILQSVEPKVKSLA